jgi:hypothetical protein
MPRTLSRFAKGSGASTSIRRIAVAASRGASHEELDRTEAHSTH